MKKLYQVLYVIICLFSTHLVSKANEMKKGIKVELLSSTMEFYGYKTTTAQMLATKKDTDLKFFQVGQGLLIATFLKKGGIVTGLRYHLSDDKSKSERTVFSLPVISFNAASGEMRIDVTKPAEK